MAYKMVKEWRSPNGMEHEITVYKYNLSHDEMVRYFYSKVNDGVEIRTYLPNELRIEFYQVA